MVKPSKQQNVYELLPKHFTPRFDGFSDSAPKAKIFIIMIGRTSCIHCKIAEPQFHDAADKVANDGISENVKYGIVHLDHDEWQKAEEKRNGAYNVMKFLSPDNTEGMIPDYSVVIDGVPIAQKPLQRDADTLHLMTLRLFTELVSGRNFNDNGVVVSRNKGTSWYVHDDLDESYEDDLDYEDEYNSVMTNFEADRLYDVERNPLNDGSSSMLPSMYCNGRSRGFCG
jgi:thiol-disulfide isomerase/thioredoxin